MHTGTDRWVGAHIANRYRVLGSLGGGGMATVYRARDEHFGSDVVIKAPLPYLIQQDPNFLKRFVHEVRALAQLSHPHILGIVDYATHDGLPYAVMPFLSGGSLRDRIGHSDSSPPPVPRPVTELSSWLPGIARALDYVHKRKIVHRDVKPDNVMFNGEGLALLTDFGLVKMLPAAGQAWNLTMDGSVIGTPAYMAPEILLRADSDNPAADQYALAASVFEALAGRVPYTGKSPAEVAVKQSTQALPDLLELAPNVPVPVAKALRRALALDPQERFATCQDFADAVKAGIEASKQVVRLGPPKLKPGQEACPVCRRIFALPPDKPDWRLQCPNCGHVFRATNPPPAAAVPTPQSQPTAENTRPASKPVGSNAKLPRVKKKAKRSKRPAWILPAMLAGGAGLAVVVVVVLVSLLRDPVNEFLGNNTIEPKVVPPAVAEKVSLAEHAKINLSDLPIEATFAPDGGNVWFRYASGSAIQSWRLSTNGVTEVLKRTDYCSNGSTLSTDGRYAALYHHTKPNDRHFLVFALDKPSEAVVDRIGGR